MPTKQKPKPKKKPKACCPDMENFGEHFGECKNKPKEKDPKQLF